MVLSGEGFDNGRPSLLHSRKSVSSVYKLQRIATEQRYDAPFTDSVHMRPNHLCSTSESVQHVDFVTFTC